jgi:hypothetical protein
VGDVASVPEDARQAVEDFVGRLTSEERMLIVLSHELYEDDWDEMVADLKARLEGRPYIFRLAHRITDDLERIQRLRDFESRQSVRLGDYVKLE